MEIFYRVISERFVREGTGISMTGEVRELRDVYVHTVSAHMPEPEALEHLAKMKAQFPRERHWVEQADRPFLPPKRDR